jgi:hypothetical protein
MHEACMSWFKACLQGCDCCLILGLQGVALLLLLIEFAVMIEAAAVDRPPMRIVSAASMVFSQVWLHHTIIMMYSSASESISLALNPICRVSSSSFCPMSIIVAIVAPES